METCAGHFFRSRALLFSSVDGNELKALGEDLDSSWTGAISWTIGLVSQYSWTFPPGDGKNCASALSGSGARVVVTGFHSSAVKDVDHDEL